MEQIEIIEAKLFKSRSNIKLMIAAKLIMTFCCIDSFRAYNQLESKFSSNQHNAALHLYASQRVQHTQSIGPIILYKDHSLHCRATTNSNFRSSSYYLGSFDYLFSFLHTETAEVEHYNDASQWYQIFQLLCVSTNCFCF